MEIAYCATTQSRHTAAEFSVLPTDTLAAYRRHLSCPDCKGPGYYRRASRDGKKACFGADHRPDCPQARTGGTSAEPSQYAIAAAQLIKESGIIELILDRPPVTSAEELGHESGEDPDVGPRIAHTEGDPTPLRERCGPNAVLRYLIECSNFSKSDVRVNTGGAHNWFARNLFINLKDVTEHEHLARPFAGFWGFITDASKDGTWLNTGGRDAVSIRLDEKYRTHLFRAMGIEDPEQLAGCNALAFGALKKSRAGTGKLYIVPLGIQWLAIRLSKG